MTPHISLRLNSTPLWAVWRISQYLEILCTTSTFDGEFYRWTPGGEAQKLDIESFTPAADSRILQADFQGNLYVFYRVSQTDTGSIDNYLVKYDAFGMELARENISRLTRQFMPYETAVDEEGRLYLMGSGRLLQFDGACNYVGAAETPEDEDLIWLAGDEGDMYTAAFEIPEHIGDLSGKPSMTKRQS